MATKTVNSFAELKSAIEDTETTIIEIVADITFSGGIKIPTEKSELTIEGNGHKITDNNSSSYTDAIYVPSGTGARTVTVQNVEWSGRNYYGVVCVYDSASNSSVTTIYNNVTYVGPQMIYNRYGTTVVRNSAVSIEKNGSGVSAQEFCEGNRLILGGKVVVKSAATSGSVVWFPYAGSAFSVEADADVTFEVPQTYMFYTDSAAKPPFSFGENSSTKITVKRGLFYASGSGAHIASSFTLSKNASLRVTSSENGGVPLFKCSGNFTVGNGAELFFIMPTKGSSPLMYFSAAATVLFDAPKNVVLYSNGGKVLSFAAGSASSPNTVSLLAGQINCWTAAKTPYESAGGFDDLPSSRLKKANGEKTSVTQKLTTSAPTSTESNLADGDDGYPLSAASFDLTKISVLSLGSLELSIDKITDISSAVSGNTDPSSSVVCDVGGASGVSEENGAFSISLPSKLAVGEKVEVKSNKNFLTSEETAEVYGSVTVKNLKDLPFNAFCPPLLSAKVLRLNPDWTITLLDTRTIGGKWSLYVSEKSPLSSSDNTIESAVAFSSDGKKNTLVETPMLVAEGTSEAAGEINVTWNEEEGIMLSFDEEEEYKKGNYSATLDWGVDFK